VLFHLHQSAEKYIKSLLAFNNVEYPKVHDLELLSQLCNSNDISTGMDIELLIELSDFAVEGRYSYIFDKIDEVEKYIKMLEKVLSNSTSDS
jgi:HEPN domain-containing protein